MPSPFDLTGKTFGSKANAMLTLHDDQGNALASNNSFDGADPLLVYPFTKSGKRPQVSPGARIRWTVTMKFKPVKMEAKPAIRTPTASVTT